MVVEVVEASPVEVVGALLLVLVLLVLPVVVVSVGQHRASAGERPRWVFHFSSPHRSPLLILFVTPDCGGNLWVTSNNKVSGSGSK
ncbi:hypothetical protein AOLI_G00072120 [Acnodon oligacanthus]